MLVIEELVPSSHKVQDDGTEKVIAYASRSLSKPERNYCVTRKELLAVVYFIRYFRSYLLGQTFTLRTDHGSLLWLRNFKQPEGQLARWLEQLQEYQFTIVHRPGRKHGNADALSRIPCPQCHRPSHEYTPQPPLVIALSSLRCDEIQLRNLQLQDDSLAPIIDLLQKGLRPDMCNNTTLNPELRRLYHMFDQLVLNRGLLCRNYQISEEDPCHLQVVVPHTLRQSILQEIHAGAVSGHLGSGKDVKHP